MTADPIGGASGPARTPPVRRAVTSTHPFQVLRPSGPYAALDSHRAWRPSVLRGGASTLRMWYGGDDGTTRRILAAEQRPRTGWARLGVVLEPGAAGASDAAGVDAPSVVRTDAGFLMAYAGSDKRRSRIHLATSTDGESWSARGPVALWGRTASVTSPCLLATDDGLMLWATTPGEDGRPCVVAATSPDGKAWTDVGPVLGPEAGEDGVTDGWVVDGEDGLLMLHARRSPGVPPTIGLATSEDGLSWVVGPEALDLGRRHHDAGAIGGPTGARLRSGSLRVWYAAMTEGDTDGGCRLWSADVSGDIRGGR
jgi:hypothetical protein